MDLAKQFAIEEMSTTPIPGSSETVSTVTTPTTESEPDSSELTDTGVQLDQETILKELEQGLERVVETTDLVFTRDIFTRRRPIQNQCCPWWAWLIPGFVFLILGGVFLYYFWPVPVTCLTAFDGGIVYRINIAALEGGLADLQENIEYVNDLGVKYILLSDGIGSDGYTFSHFFHVGSESKIKPEFESLVKTAHMWGIRVMVELNPKFTNINNTVFDMSQGHYLPYKGYENIHQQAKKRGQKSQNLQYSICVPEEKRVYSPKEYKRKLKKVSHKRTNRYMASATQNTTAENITTHNTTIKQPNAETSISGNYYVDMRLKSCEYPILNVANEEVKKKIKEVLEYWASIGSCGFMFTNVGAVYMGEGDLDKDPLMFIEKVNEWLGESDYNNIIVEHGNDGSKNLGKMRKSYWEKGARLVIGKAPKIMNKNMANTRGMGKKSQSPFKMIHNLQKKFKKAAADVIKGKGIASRITSKGDYYVSGQYVKPSVSFTIAFMLPGTPIMIAGEELALGGRHFMNDKINFTTMRANLDKPDSVFNFVMDLAYIRRVGEISNKEEPVFFDTPAENVLAFKRLTKGSHVYNILINVHPLKPNVGNYSIPFDVCLGTGDTDNVIVSSPKCQCQEQNECEISMEKQCVRIVKTEG